MSEATNPPDLQSILATLASLTNQQPQSQQTPPQPTEPPRPSTTTEQAPPKPPTPQTRKSQPQQQQLFIDPSRITSWPQAKHCITKISKSTPTFLPTIRHLRAEQRAHEVHWYEKRQALKSKQMTRGKESKRALSILSALNPAGGGVRVKEGRGSPDGAVGNGDGEVEREREVREFDREVYAQQVKLNVEQEERLRGLGVPFFGMRADLIVGDGEEVKGKVEGGEEWSRPITVVQLRKLQGDMVGLLEDMTQ